MANVGGQKTKLIILLRYLYENTDENNPVSASGLIKELKKYGIEAERKGIYRDLEILKDADIDIVKTSKGYYVGSRTFELAELKLLADAVGASRFITDRKSAQLVEKLESLTSKEQAKQLRRQVVVSGRTKTDNEKILYAIDEIYNCIAADCQMSFQYEDWTLGKKKELRHGGERYLVSPAFMLWDSENYYLVAYDEKARNIRHYRVDKMVSVRPEAMQRGGIEQRKALNREDYSKVHFGMFAGNRKNITLKCKKDLVGPVIDRLGTGITIMNDSNPEFVRIRCEVEVSPIFYGWLTGIGAAIDFPKEEAQLYKEHLLKQLNLIDL